MNLKTLCFKTLLMVVMIASVYGIYLGSRWIMGDISAYPARYAIEAWEKDQEIPAPAVIDELIAKIERSLEWESDNPEYHDLKGVLLHAKGIKLIQGGNNYPTEVFEEAAASHKEAIRLRPTWPYYWGNLALMKAYAGQIDSEHSEAILNANKYGPWELAVQVNIVHAGLLSWNSLQHVDRLIVVSNVQKGLRLNKQRDIRMLVEKFGRTVEICNMLVADEFSARLCAKKASS